MAADLRRFTLIRIRVMRVYGYCMSNMVDLEILGTCWIRIGRLDRQIPKPCRRIKVLTFTRRIAIQLGPSFLFASPSRSRFRTA